MTKAEVNAMEKELIELSAVYRLTEDPKAQAKYQALHARWMAAKDARDARG